MTPILSKLKHKAFLFTLTGVIFIIPVFLLGNYFSKPDVQVAPITQAESNTPPVILGLADVTVKEGEQLSIPFIVEDANNDAIEYSVEYIIGTTIQSALPEGAQLLVHPLYQERTLMWMPNFTQAGSYKFQFRAVDARGAETKQVINVTVEDKQNSPSIEFLPDQDSLLADLEPIGQRRNVFILSEPVSPLFLGLGPGAVQVKMKVRDPENDTVTLSASGMPELGVTFLSGVYILKSKGINNGDTRQKYDITVKAVDSKGNETQRMFTVKIPPSTTLAVMEFDRRFAYPHLPGRLIRGKVSLDLTFDNAIHDLQTDVVGVSLQYTIDEKPVSPILKDSYIFEWDSASVPDGPHVLSVRIIDVPSEDIFYLDAWPTTFVTDNTPGAITGQQKIPIAGNPKHYHKSSSAVDWFSYSGKREYPEVHSYPVKFSPSAKTMSDPNELLKPENWFMEPIMSEVVPWTGSKETARLYTVEGHSAVVDFMNQRAAPTSEAALEKVKVHDNVDGGRGISTVTAGYSTFVANPEGTGWIGVDLAGRVFRLDLDGNVTTIAGVVTRSDILPELGNPEKNTVGNFENNQLFEMPVDLAFDPRDSKILYIADTENHRVAKIDFHSAPPKITTYAGQYKKKGYQDGLAGSALFHEPYSIALTQDGTMYIAEFHNNVIRKISADGKEVSTLVGKGPANPPNTQTVITDPAPWVKDGAFEEVTINFPQVIRLDSEENIIVGENVSGYIRKIDLKNKQVKNIATAPRDSRTTEWIWLDVDRRGNIGPVDDILFSSSRDSGANAHLWRYSKDGSRKKVFAENWDSDIMDGQLSYAQEVGGHYPWAVAIDDEEARFVTGGFGNLNAISVRRFLPSDPVYQWTKAGSPEMTAFKNGGRIYERGTVMGFPYASRPTFSYINGNRGSNGIGSTPSFDELVELYPTDEALANYIQKGMGGVIPRPEITGNDLRDLIFFIRRSSLQGHTTKLELKPDDSDVRPSEIRNVKTTKIDNTTLRVSWQTDEPAIGVVNYGRPNSFLTLFTPLESGFTKDHSAIIENVLSPKIEFEIKMKDKAGNQTISRPNLVTLSDAPPADSDVLPPTVPANLKAQAISSSQINLNWSASTDNVRLDGYKIYRDNTLLATVAPHIITYSDTGLNPSTNHMYTVSAFDAAGNESRQSTSASATTLSGLNSADLNQDSKVDQLDFDILKSNLNKTDRSDSDINQNGIVDVRDLGILMSKWGR